MENNNSVITPKLDGGVVLKWRVIRYKSWFDLKEGDLLLTKDGRVLQVRFSCIFGPLFHECHRFSRDGKYLSTGGMSDDCVDDREKVQVVERPKGWNPVIPKHLT